MALHGLRVVDPRLVPVKPLLPIPQLHRLLQVGYHHPSHLINRQDNRQVSPVGSRLANLQESLLDNQQDNHHVIRQDNPRDSPVPCPLDIHPVSRLINPPPCPPAFQGMGECLGRRVGSIVQYARPGTISGMRSTPGPALRVGWAHTHPPQAAGSAMCVRGTATHRGVPPPPLARERVFVSILGRKQCYWC